MARVLVSLKIYPKDAEAKREEVADKIRKALPQDYIIIKASEEPIAFGYTALKLYLTFPEETEGGTEKLEEILRGIEDIDDFEIESVSRLSSF
ncbi:MULTISPECIES: elongation factor 1-beta [Fervidicoccus]|jgi:elongation factor 1-beta|uniref:Elongation factor 1-beta n=1 Tax=Fervidicoccus fontis (strain DSM 19380 / JCM 18336 / VKM B-2539 / Kam940) TaxID=1163730 RepID=I0A043_FERFK|nr:elongation factor 1-beta [Fervidicoccus fontis]AFH42350.1 translation elongation factor 1B (aEF-1B) [Fervidicoccus fontis Kam940]PMB76359.1 MAG: elongation factor 1-beta [Fervidicoccus fontis]